MTATTTNPYQVLGVPEDASAADIKTAYRKLALRYHPDRNPGDAEAEEQFKRISEAYATLRDPEARARFDRYGPDVERGGYAPDFSTMDWQTIFREADIPMDWDARGGAPRTGNAVFDALFGVMTGMFRNAGLLPGETREVTLRVPLGVARGGAVRRVRVPGPSVCPRCRGARVLDGERCPDCGGSGVRNGRAEVDVRVPAGVKHGTRLRLRGMGGPGNPPGDLFVRLEVDLPEHARVVGNEVHADLYLTPLEAARGIDTHFEGVPVHVPGGLPAGRTVRVAGGGLDRGDLVLTVHHDVWRGLWRGTADWFRRLAEGRTGG